MVSSLKAGTRKRSALPRVVSSEQSWLKEGHSALGWASGGDNTGTSHPIGPPRARKGWPVRDTGYGGPHPLQRLP